MPKRGKESKQEPWLLTGLTPVDQLVEFLPIQDLPETAGKDYKTLGGMITTHLGRIPNPGDKFTYQGLSFEVLTMDQRRIDKVRVTKSQGVLLSNSV